MVNSGYDEVTMANFDPYFGFSILSLDTSWCKMLVAYTTPSTGANDCTYR